MYKSKRLKNHLAHNNIILTHNNQRIAQQPSQSDYAKKHWHHGRHDPFHWPILLQLRAIGRAIVVAVICASIVRRR